STPLVVVFAVEELRLSYGDWTWANGLAFPIAQLLVIPIAGRLSDAAGVVRTTAISFVVLGVFFASLPFVATAGGLIAAHALYGVAMAGVDVGWALGPLRFAPQGRARVYMSVHFSLVGIRSILAPLLGYGIKSLFSLETAFACSAGLMAAACATALAARRARLG
ncbi:MAG: hypothetical protein ACREID_06730, partial [Planctomycetota bacterium]